MAKIDEKIVEKLKEAGIQVKDKQRFGKETQRILQDLLDKLEETKTENQGKQGNQREIELTPKQKTIIDAIKEESEQEVRFKDLAEKLGMKQNHLWDQLNILWKLGIVEKIKLSRKSVFYKIP